MNDLDIRKTPNLKSRATPACRQASEAHFSPLPACFLGLLWSSQVRFGSCDWLQLLPKCPCCGFQVAALQSAPQWWAGGQLTNSSGGHHLTRPPLRLHQRTSDLRTGKTGRAITTEMTACACPYKELLAYTMLAHPEIFQGRRDLRTRRWMLYKIAAGDMSSLDSLFEEAPDRFVP
jgi:hypothetical protein